MPRLRDSDRDKLERAVTYGWYDIVAEIGAPLTSRDDINAVKEIIREKAPRYDYYEIGSTMYYDGDLEIDPFYGVRGTGLPHD